MTNNRNPGRRRVVRALPAVPGRRPQGQPPVPLPGPVVLSDDDEVDRAIPAAPVQPQVPTGIVPHADEVVVAPQDQKTADAEAQEEPPAFLPWGTPLLSVAGEAVPKSAVGLALEFIEFCDAFHEAIDMKEVEGRMSLHEIVRGCKLKRGWQSQVVRVHVRLLSVILGDESVSPSLDSENSWLKVLKSYLDKETQPLSMLKYARALAGGVDGYLSLAVEEKLKLLNRLCNDSLSTEVLRGHIEKVKAKYEEKEADDKKKEIKAGKSIASTSEPITEDKRTPSVRTRSALIREPANLPETFSGTGSEALRSDAVKTEAIVRPNGSRALWKLKGVEDRRAVISQVIYDIGGTPNEDWTVYSEKDKEALAVYLV